MEIWWTKYSIKSGRCGGGWVEYRESGHSLSMYNGREYKESEHWWLCVNKAEGRGGKIVMRVWSRTLINVKWAFKNVHRFHDCSFGMSINIRKRTRAYIYALLAKYDYFIILLVTNDTHGNEYT